MEVGHESSSTSSAYQNTTQVIAFYKLVLIYVRLVIYLFLGLQRCSYEEGTFVIVFVFLLHSASGLWFWSLFVAEFITTSFYLSHGIGLLLLVVSETVSVRTSVSTERPALQILKDLFTLKPNVIWSGLFTWFYDHFRRFV